MGFSITPSVVSSPLAPQEPKTATPKQRIQQVVPAAALEERSQVASHFSFEDLQSQIEGAKIQDATIAAVAERYAEDESIGGEVSVLKNVSSANIMHAETALKDGKYADVLRHVDNVHKAARGAAEYAAYPLSRTGNELGD